MKNLQYATLVNDKHDIRVTTWNNNANGNTLAYKFTVDGKDIAEGVIKDANETFAGDITIVKTK